MLKNAIWLFVFTVIVILVFLPSYTRMQDLKEKNRAYLLQLQQLKIKNTQLKREHRLLQSDPVYLEKVAREKMGLVKEGEVVYQIKPKASTQTNSTKP